MKVKVYPGPFCSTDVLDEDGCIELPEGARVYDVLREIKLPLPLRLMGLYMVNYKKAKADTRLKDGDIVSIIGPLAGG